MRTPPAAHWVVTSNRRWQGVQALLWMLAAAAVGVWLLQRRGLALALQEQPNAADGLAGLGWVAPFVLAAGLWGWRMGRQPAGVLRWSGSQWRWQLPSGASQEVNVQAMVDLGGWLLLRTQPVLPDSQTSASVHGIPLRLFRRGVAASPGWLSLSGPQDPQGVQASSWSAFRAAVYSCGARTHGLNEPGNPSF